MEDARYCFVGEWYDPQACMTRSYQIFVYPRDISIEMFDIKNRRTFLKKTKCDNLSLKDFFIGNIVNIYSRQLKLVDFGDDFTRTKIATNQQSTLAIIKPHAMKHKADILQSIQRNLLSITNIQSVQLSRAEAMDFYDEHRSKPFFNSLVSMMTEGPIIAIELMGSDAIKKWRDMIGPTDAMEARTQKPESLRGRFAEDNTRNACHGSDSEDSAAREIRFFFPRDSRHRMTTSTMNDVTCCVVKPHGTQFLSEIIREIEQRGFKINAIKSFLLTRAEAEEFFEVYKGVVTEYIDMVTDLCTGMIVAMEIAADGDPQKFRSVVGPADPEICKHVRPDTLRAKFGKTKVKNALHVTDLPGDAPLEVEYFFRILAQ